MFVGLVVVGCGPGDDPGLDYGRLPLAGGARIDKVSVYQGVEKALYEAPGIFAFGSVPPPVLANRELVVRVGASATEDVDPRVTVVTLDFQSSTGALSLGQIVDLGEEWADWDPTSTATFTVPAELVSDGSELSVAIRDTTVLDPVDASTDEASWSSEEGNPDGAIPRPLVPEPAEGLEIVIIPVRYNGDGSGRMPDVTPVQLDRILEGFRAAYPVAWIDVTLGATLPWPNELLSSGSGWSTLLDEIAAMRASANVPATTYYYGLFSPTNTMEAYCGGGCTLGLSLLAYSPSDIAAHASIGVGWTGEDSVEVMLHEIGHAHGRDHAPCGTSGDLSYPYPGGGIGVWGFDRRTNEYLDPEATKDVMSYCAPVWVSDYTFNALHDRIVAVAGLAGRRAAPASWERWLVDADGLAVRRGTSTSYGDPGGRWVTATEPGTETQVTGTFLPFDHLDGGILWVKTVDPDIHTLRVPFE